MWENTLLVLTSDNGGPIYLGDFNDAGGANNYPLRGGKRSNFEGGVRTNAFVSGGVIPASRRGQIEQGLIGIEDWYSTFCFLAGVDPTDHKSPAAGIPPVDSHNMWPLLSGQTTTSPRSEVYLGAAVPLPGLRGGPTIAQAIIDSDGYKLIAGNIIDGIWQGPFFPNQSSTTDWDESTDYVDCGGANPVYPYPGACLFNVFSDPTEHEDIAAKNPAKVAQLTTRLKQLTETAFSPLRGGTTNVPCETSSTKWSGFLGPWLE